MPTDLPKNHDRYLVPGLERGLEILQVIGEAKRPLSVKEISEQLSLPRSSVFRLNYTLEYLGFIAPSADGRGYDLTANVLRLGYAYLSTRDITVVARPVLDRLAAETGLSTHLAILSGKEIVYLVHSPGRASYVSNITAGDRLPAHASPMGLVILAHESEEKLVSLYANAELASMTEHTPRSFDTLLETLAQVRATGFAVSHGAVHPGGQSIAAPVWMPDGHVGAAIGISGPNSAFAAEAPVEHFAPNLLKAAAEASERLGYRPSR